MKYYFCHIAKTGGTSVRNFLYQQFPDKCYNDYSICNDEFITSREVFYIDRAHNLDYYTNHKLSFMSTELSDAKTFAIVRNPVDRFISSFFFFSQLKGLNYNCISIEHAIEEQLIKKNCCLKVINQNFHLSQGRGFDYILDRINKNCTIIPFEYINEIPALLGINGELPRENTGNKQEVDNVIRSKILLLSQDDDYLHKWCLDNYDKMKERF